MVLSWKMGNRRRYERIARSLVTYFKVHGSDVHEKAGVTKDLSVGGVMLKIEDEVQLGDVLELEISIDESKVPIQVRGKTVRVDGISKGFEFLDLTDESKAELKQYCEDRYSKGFA